MNAVSQGPPSTDSGGRPGIGKVAAMLAGFVQNAGQGSGPPWQNAVRLVLVLAILLVVLRDSFVCEDAFILFRTVDNWLGGFGLRWNVAERCQSFTSPLWLFAVSAVYGLTGEIFYSVLSLSLLVTGVALVLFSSRVVSGFGWDAIVGLTVLLFSRAFVDFSASGLENPLLHLLLVLFVLSWKAVESAPATPGRLFPLSLACCLCVLTRMDTVLLLLPAMLLVIIDTARNPNRRRLFGALAMGFLPFVLWEAFSVVYYGFPFPNTFYAKTTHGVPGAEIVAQGFFYLRNALAWDPLTLFAILAGIAVGLLPGFRSRRGGALAAGIIIYLGWVVSVGGDHMAGRFLSAPLLCAVIVLSSSGLGRRPGLVVLLLAVALGWNARCPTLAADFQAAECVLDQAKIIDERGCSKPEASLLARSVEFPFEMHTRAVAGREARAMGRHAVVEGWAGIFGFYAGPEVHVIDVLGLGDPLLSRLPMLPVEWRIAHFARPVPEGYQEAVIGQGAIRDPSMARYYERLSVVTRGEIWSGERFREIWRFNVGAYDELVEEYCRRTWAVEGCGDLAGIREEERAQRKLAEQLERIEKMR